MDSHTARVKGRGRLPSCSCSGWQAPLVVSWQIEREGQRYRERQREAEREGAREGGGGEGDLNKGEPCSWLCQMGG